MNITENKPVGSVLCKVHANDQDAKPFGSVMYRVAPGETEDGAEEILRVDKNTGEVRLARHVDAFRHNGFVPFVCLRALFWRARDKSNEFSRGRLSRRRQTRI